MNSYSIKIPAFCLLFSLIACINTQAQKEVKIGSQIWMSENLNVSKYRNGDMIPEIKNKKDWEKAEKEGKDGWCYYNFDPANGKKYGKIYNWSALSDSRGLAPAGWHIPTEKEWNELRDFLGGANVAEKLTSKNGFAALNGGRINGNNFEQLGKATNWWWNEENSNGSFGIYFDNGIFDEDPCCITGMYLRCVKD